jgi:DeoR/GlpR family transcriptional regulator of sugar metabolism
VSEIVPLRGGDRSGPASRRDAVRRRVLADGFARIDALARDYDVSVMTMHRDLDVLAAEGWLTKIRGAATANPSALLEAGVRERMAAQRTEKGAIAGVAAGMLGHGQTIFVDDSTTVLALAPHLIAHAPITVATNFIPVLTALADAPDVELHVLGGRYYRTQEACFGLQTVEAIRQLRADLFFMSTTGITAGRCYHRSEITIMVKRAFMNAAARSVLLVDHAKFGRPGPHLLCGLEAYDAVITDDGVDPEDLAELRAHCAEVLVAHVDA